MPLQHVEEALDAAAANVSLNQQVGSEGDGELGDLFADTTSVDPSEEAADSFRRQMVRDAIAACRSASAGSSSCASGSTASRCRWRRSARRWA